jgi:hypothetical protein
VPHIADRRGKGLLARVPGQKSSVSSAADLKFLHHLPQSRSGTSNRKAALES